MPWEYVTIGDTTKKVLADVVDTDKYVQGIKLVDPTDGEEAPLVVMQSTQPTLPVSIIGNTGGTLTFASAIDVASSALTIDTSEYAANDCLHAAVTFANAAAVAAGSGWITEVRVYDYDPQASELEIWFFNADLASAPAKNAAFTLTDTDLAKVVGVVSTADGQWWSAGGRLCVIPLGPPLPFKLASGTSLYCMVKVKSTETWTAATDLALRVHLLRD